MRLHAMFSMYSGILESFQIGSQRHAMLVHLPIVLSMIALPLLVMLAVSRGKSVLWRRLTLITLLIGLLFSRLSVDAGHMAMGDLDLPLTEQATALLEAHEAAGQGLWWFFLITAALTCMTYVKKTWVRWPAVLLGLVAGLVLFARVALVAHQGGSLVYDHGVGVPATDNNVEFVERNN